MKQTNEIKKDIYKITNDTILFFDMDETLIYTNLANFLSFNKAIQSVTNKDNGLTYDPNKRFNRSNLKDAIPNLSEIQYDKIIREKEQYYNDFLDKTELNQTIVDILHRYSKTNMTVLVTNCRKERAMAILNHFGLVDKFSHIFHRQFSESDQRINKYQFAISELGLQPSLVIAFENEEIEIIDAKQAGIQIINPSIISI